MANEDIVKLVLKSLLTASANPLYLNQLTTQYYDVEGNEIPVASFGCRNVLEFLRKHNDTFKIIENNSNVLVQAVVTSKSAHVANLVAKQRNKKNNKNRVSYRAKPNAFNRRNYQSFYKSWGNNQENQQNSSHYQNQSQYSNISNNRYQYNNYSGGFQYGHEKAKIKPLQSNNYNSSRNNNKNANVTATKQQVNNTVGNQKNAKSQSSIKMAKLDQPGPSWQGQKGPKITEVKPATVPLKVALPSAKVTPLNKPKVSTATQTTLATQNKLIQTTRSNDNIENKSKPNVSVNTSTSSNSKIRDSNNNEATIDTTIQNKAPIGDNKASQATQPNNKRKNESVAPKRKRKRYKRNNAAGYNYNFNNQGFYYNNYGYNDYSHHDYYQYGFNNYQYNFNNRSFVPYNFFNDARLYNYSQRVYGCYTQAPPSFEYTDSQIIYAYNYYKSLMRSSNLMDNFLGRRY